MPRRAPPRGFDPQDVAPPPLGEGPWAVAAVALDVSGSCNLACRYCVEAATQPRRRPMSAETLEAAWRLVCRDRPPRAGCSIRLGSGEPLLAAPLLHTLAELVEREGGCAAEGRPDVFLTTNGTLADVTVRNWLVASGWHVKVSLDGPRLVHDRWRVTRKGAGTFEQVAEAVADLAARMPERLSATAVLCRGADPAEVFEAIAGLGVRRIELVPVAHRDTAILPGRDDVRRYERFVDAYARRWSDAETDDVPTLVRFETRVRRVLGYDTQRVPCGAGRSFIGVGSDGGLYPCFRFIGVTPYRIGRVTTGLDVDAAAAFRRGPGRPYEERAPCRACWAAPLCGGPCFACSELLGPGGGDPLPLRCAYVLADARAAVRLVTRLRERDPERLLAFLPEAREAFARLT